MMTDSYMQMRKYDQAEVLYRSVLKTQERVGGTKALDHLWTMYSLAECLMKQNKREEAILYGQRAFDGLRLVYGTNMAVNLTPGPLLEYLKHKK